MDGHAESVQLRPTQGAGWRRAWRAWEDGPGRYEHEQRHEHQDEEEDMRL